MYHDFYIMGVGGVTEVGVFNSDSNLYLRNDQLFGLKERVDEKYIQKKRDLNCMSESQCMLAVSAREALDGSIYFENGKYPKDTNVFVSCSIGERDDIVDEKVCQAWGEEKQVNALIARSKPTQLLRELPNLYSANLSILLDVNGKSLAFVGENSASVNCFNYAFEDSLTSDTARVSLVGGTFNGKKKVISDACTKSGFEFARPEDFGVASSVVILSDEEKNKNNAIYKVKYFGNFSNNEVNSYVSDNNPDVFCFSSEMDVNDNIEVRYLSDSMLVIDIVEYFGYLSEATLPFQISLCASLKSENDSGRYGKIIIACQLLNGKYAVYELAQCE